MYSPRLLRLRTNTSFTGMCFVFIHTRTEPRISGGIHPCKVRREAFKVIKPSAKMVHLPVVFKHANDIKPVAKDPFHERLLESSIISTLVRSAESSRAMASLMIRLD